MTDETVRVWRREKRAALLAQRQAMPLEARQRATQLVTAKLSRFVSTRKFAIVGLYWPIKHEINLLPWADAVARQYGTVLCLPVVVEPKKPLEFRRWSQGDPLDRGIWDIPVPARRDVVVPDLMLAPLVGFDLANYRLGYGGGYFDRTLAALQTRPTAVGVGYDFGALETIFPQSYDIRMDAVVTERRDTFPTQEQEQDQDG
jgi:5,10-methenyltetrahydrofolate synthetase